MRNPVSESAFAAVPAPVLNYELMFIDVIIILINKHVEYLREFASFLKSSPDESDTFFLLFAAACPTATSRSGSHPGTANKVRSWATFTFFSPDSSQGVLVFFRILTISLPFSRTFDKSPGDSPEG